MEHIRKINSDLVAYALNLLKESSWGKFVLALKLDKPTDFDAENAEFFGTTMKVVYSETGDVIPSPFLDSQLVRRVIFRNSPIDSQGRPIWNLFNIEIFPDGQYNSQFLLDEVAQLDDEIKTIYAAISGLYESLFERIAFEIKPDIDWGNAIATVIVHNGKVDDSSTIVLADSSIYALNLDGLWQRELPKFQQKANSAPLNEHFPAWNTLVYKLRYKDDFNEREDVSFELRDLTVS